MNRTPLCLLLFLAAHLVVAQQPVSGTVRSLNNIPLGGVNVLLMGTSTGTVTDMNGNFKIDLPEGQSMLLFAFRKQKPLEHSLIIRRNHQYQINVVLANTTQTFHRSEATTAVLPIDAPKILGAIVDQSGRPLAGASITQGKDKFKTVTGQDGSFILPVAHGDNTLSFQYSGMKSLDYSFVTSDSSNHYSMEVQLVEDRPRYRDHDGSVTAFFPSGGDKKRP